MISFARGVVAANTGLSRGKTRIGASPSNTHSVARITMGIRMLPAGSAALAPAAVRLSPKKITPTALVKQATANPPMAANPNRLISGRAVTPLATEATALNEAK